MHNDKYGVTAPKQIDRDRFIDMLEVLPPCRWRRYADGVEWFHVSERLSGDVVAWFARVGETYWEMQDLSTLSYDALNTKLRAAIHKE